MERGEGDSFHSWSNRADSTTEYHTRCGRALLRARKGFDFFFVQDPADHLERSDPVRLPSCKTIPLYPRSPRTRDRGLANSRVRVFSGLMPCELNLGLRKKMGMFGFSLKDALWVYKNCP